MLRNYLNYDTTQDANDSNIAVLNNTLYATWAERDTINSQIYTKRYRMAIPTTVILQNQNIITKVYPIPVKERTVFSWQGNTMDPLSRVEVHIYTIVGERISKLSGSFLDQKIVWQRGDVASGIYFYYMILTHDKKYQLLDKGKITAYERSPSTIIHS